MNEAESLRKGLAAFVFLGDTHEERRRRYETLRFCNARGSKAVGGVDFCARMKEILEKEFISEGVLQPHGVTA